MNLSQYLEQNGVEEDLKDVILGLAEACKRISHEVMKSDGSKEGSENASGEDQLKLDVLSDKIVHEEMAKVPACGLLGSEEMEDVDRISEGPYALAYDPLDGSSLVDVNLTVGTIVGIYKSDTLIGVNGDDQVAAVVGEYGPSTMLFVTVRKGTVCFILTEDGEFMKCYDLSVADDGKMFAPGNLRACKTHEKYLELLNYWAKEQYRLRYSGGFVPDVGQIMIKGGGIFSYPGYEEAPDGKLRLLFECAPMALLVEQAGGVASDTRGRLLDQVAQELHQRTPIVVGSKNEVEKALEFLG